MSEDFPLMTVGILSYNRKKELKRTLLASQNSKYKNIEIIVVDNASEDGSSKMVRKEFPYVKLFRMKDNIGVAGRNIFLFNAKGKYIIQFDDDSMPSDSLSISKIVKFLERHPDVDVLCTQVIDCSTGRSETEGWEKYAIRGNLNEGYEGIFIHAAGVVYRKECIQRIKGYSQEFFFGLEEGDISLQLINRGCKIIYKPDIITYHRKSSLHRNIRREIMLRTRNGIWLFWKYFPFYMAIFLILRYLLRMAVSSSVKPSGIKYFLKGSYLGLTGLSVGVRERELLSKEAIKMTKKWRQQLLSLYPLFQKLINRYKNLQKKH